MMQLILKEFGHRVTVYGTRDDKNGFPMFLIRYNGQWSWKSAKCFAPLEVDDWICDGDAWKDNYF